MHDARRHPKRALVLVAMTAATAAVSGCAMARTVARGLHFTTRGDVVELRDRSADVAPLPAEPLLVLAIDGVGRDLLYDLLRSGALPHLASLAGVQPDGAASAHLDRRW